MSYAQALTAAGATVVEYEHFGSYQGDWIALVIYNDEFCWVTGCYGSCSGCDAFEGEFGWNSGIVESDGRIFDYDTYTYRQATPEEIESYNRRLSDFGKGYLDICYSQEEIEEKVSRNLEWDDEAAAMLEFVKRHSIKKAIN